MDGLLGVAGMIITGDYGSFPKIPCVKRTSKIIPGWWFQRLRNILVSWDDSSKYMENKIHVPNHQPDNTGFGFPFFFATCIFMKKKDFLFTASRHGIAGSSFGIAPLHLPIGKKKTLPVDGYWLVINNYGL